MQNSYREIEKKFVVKGSLAQAEIDYILKRELNPAKEIYGDSLDYYFAPSSKGSADFVRLRIHENGEDAELTVKTKDQKTNFNRLEINFEGSPQIAAYELCKTAFGAEITSLKKKYSVFFPQSAPTTVVSTYVVEGVNRVFVEVEAPSEELVNDMVVRILGFIEMKEERKSLYELYVKPKLPLTWGHVLMGGT